MRRCDAVWATVGTREMTAKIYICFSMVDGASGNLLNYRVYSGLTAADMRQWCWDHILGINST